MKKFNFNYLSIGESYVGQDDDIIKIIYERTDFDTVKVMCYAPNTDKIVMSAFMAISIGRTKVEDVDPDFWEITLDGKPITNPTNLKFEHLHVNVKANKDDYRVELKSN